MKYRCADMQISNVQMSAGWADFKF